MTHINKILCLVLLLMSGAAHTAFGQDTLRVLCVGNSFTYFYDSHQRLVELAEAEGHTIVMKAAYVGGYTFNRHLNDLKTIGAVESALYDGAFDCVFLQDQSQAFGRYGQNPKQYALEKTDTKDLVARVREYSPKARIWLEQTWSYTAGNYGGFGSLEAFDKYTAKGAQSLAKASKTMVSPIADAFVIVRQERPDLNLYEPDCKHQSLLGTYLKSCVNYLLIYGKPFSQHAANCTIAPADAAYLRAVAERVVLK